MACSVSQAMGHSQKGGKIYSGLLHGQSADRSKTENVVESLEHGVVVRSPPLLELQNQDILFQPFLMGSVSYTNVPEENQK